MKLISLNIWGGKIYEPLLDFIKNYSKEVDVFCFQEVLSSEKSEISRGARLNIFEEFEEIFFDYRSFFDFVQEGVDIEGVIKIPTRRGQAIFVKNGFEFEKNGFEFTHQGFNTFKNGDFMTLGTGFQYLQLKNKEKPLMIINVHGISLPGDKLDTPERLIQSEKIKDFIKDFKGQKIICGDFNLMPETESIKILEQGMRNLIKDFKITDTRGEIHAQKYEVQQKFADYTFVSADIQVKDFQVLRVGVSDHLPMILDFN